LKTAVTHFEMILLRILKFETCFQLPHSFIVIYCEDYFNHHNTNQNKSKVLSQTSLNWLNDSLLCPEIQDLLITDKSKQSAKSIALSCLYMALKTHGAKSTVKEVFFKS
jgi:hypothetical protein